MDLNRIQKNNFEIDSYLKLMHGRCCNYVNASSKSVEGKAYHCRSHSRFESEIGLGYCPFHSNPVGFLLGEFFGKTRNRLAIVIDHHWPWIHWSLHATEGPSNVTSRPQLVWGWQIGARPMLSHSQRFAICQQDGPLFLLASLQYANVVQVDSRNLQKQS